ncbi:MAG: 2-oxo acid dehydrogenase subunit E2 [Bacteroides sp.]|mgnify:FL=1|uniref:Dihydrolipoamide acetyltransferase component of pyruvate dehydrogenase complex n=1 Tax=Phocaeicola sartorii TaxID=671267 RepID=R9HY71_9BACT|nr:2-oxo acid dehydrogenase subunit E2 [Phocaeicola sartorii]EOS08899.1 2-oxoglutarate dehydrogenase E2 component (dihydrolipoamide succinyltransferase) [Phocaeicola sartorii]MBO5508223.1 2-oxo acid dehydrogenase subunit E2 [Bacteroides sp.]MCR1847437.1 2-oxo acid dehydrogenase subunit E2 [Phocaeicola sartorii]NUK99373.1 2-oxo acid dehydrogenase subunit E2 [Phocaeicola sartorii]
MSRFEIKMPKLGESITEGTIISWSVKVGDTVQEDDVLFEVNTAKVSAEIPSPVEGKVVEILFKEGDTVPVGTVVAIVDIAGDEGTEETSLHAQSVASVQEVKEAPKAMAAKTEEERWYSPIVLQLAQAAHISKEELDRIQGTGYEGRLSKKDIKAYITRKEQGNIVLPKSAPASAQPAVSVSAQTSPAVQSSASSLATSVSGLQEGVEVREMDRVRKMIADHMVMSKHTSPHVTNVVEVDVTQLVKWRDKNKDAFFHREGVKLTYMPAITEAVAKALVAYPQVNVSVDGYHILFKKHINVGIAVSLNDGNLIVPVIHDADRLNLSGLAVAIDTLAVKARDNKLMPDDISDGTFTITNFGTFKSLFGTPIINQPQVAILGVGYIEKKPAVIETPEGDMIAIRHKMYLSLSYDHRVVDGMLGGQFLYAIKNYLENWKE